MSQFNFGVGNLWLTPSGTNPTPVRVGTLQDISGDINAPVKELYGQYKFPVDIASGKGKLSFKAKHGEFNAAIYQAVLAGATIATGRVVGVPDEVATIPSTPFQVVVANGATFKEDLGVKDVNTGLIMTRVASAPAAGQYSVNAVTGQYTFAAGDTGHGVLISYSYTVAATGKTTSFTNQLMGSGTTYTINLFNTYKGKNRGIKLYAAIIPKLGWADKNEDFTIQDLEIMAFADSSNRIIDLYTEE